MMFSRFGVSHEKHEIAKIFNTDGWKVQRFAGKAGWEEKAVSKEGGIREGMWTGRKVGRWEGGMAAWDGWGRKACEWKRLPRMRARASLVADRPWPACTSCYYVQHERLHSATSQANCGAAAKDASFLFCCWPSIWKHVGQGQRPVQRPDPLPN
jgi:hypothetical protein